jgi:hypothetical protein
METQLPDVETHMNSCCRIRTRAQQGDRSLVPGLGEGISSCGMRDEADTHLN